MRTTGTWLAVLASLTTGCDDGAGGPSGLGGQSGGMVQNPDPMATELVPCPCTLASRAVALIADLEQVDGCGVTARVAELLDGAEAAGVSVGDALQATPLDCVDATLGPGDEVLLLYAPATPGTDAGIPVPDLVFYTPLGEPISLGPNIEALPTEVDAALEVLLDVAACTRWAQEHVIANDAAMPEFDPDEQDMGIEPEPAGDADGPPVDGEEAPPADCG